MYTRKRSRLGIALALILGLVAVSHVEAALPAADDLTARKVIYEVNVNELIDNNMDAIRDGLMLLDPTDLRDIKYPVTPHIYMDLHTGWLQNLSLLKRAGQCMMKYTEKLLTLDMNFGWDDMTFDYRYLLKVLLVSRTGDLHGQMSQLKINVVIQVDFEYYQIILKRLDFVDTGKVTIALEGHILDKIYNLIIKGVTTLCKSMVLKTIETKATEMLQLEIDELNESLRGHRQFTFINLVDANRPINF